MSKKAEQWALEAYPPIKEPFQTTSSKDRRDIYIQGYNQAEKDTIERAVAWLSERGWTSAQQIKMFRKAMKEEQ